MYLADQKPPAAPPANELQTAVDEKTVLPARSGGPSRPGLPNFMQFVTNSTNATSIAEQAWMMKMANEMARRYEEERLKGSFGPASPRDEDPIPPPPAYAQ
jgi:distribution and morphology protein 34